MMLFIVVAIVTIGLYYFLFRGKAVPPICEAVYINDSGYVQNWFGNKQWRPERIVEPSNFEELRTAVQEVYQMNKEGKRMTIRMVGALHSWSACAECDGGVMVRCDKLNRILHVDTNNLTVKVEAGIQLGAFYKELKKLNLAMPSLPNTPHLTLGGIVSNAAHGTNKDYGTICSFVTAMEFMICTGEILKLFPGAPEGSKEKHYFEAAIVSWGNLGVIYSLTLHVSRDFNVLVNRRPLDYAKVHGKIAHLMSDNQSLLLGINPRSKVAFIKTQTPVPKSTTECCPSSDIWDFIVECRVFSIFYGNYEKKPWKYLLGHFLNKVATSKMKLLQIMDWDEGEFVVKSWKDRAFMNIEYVCPIEKIDQAVEIVSEVFDDYRRKGLHDHQTPFFLRNVKADKEGYLSSSKGHQLVVTIDIPYQIMDAHEVAAFKSFELKLISLGCRLSFSRKFNAGPKDALKAYPEHTKFIEAIHELDPYNMFSNQMRRDFFGV